MGIVVGEPLGTIVEGVRVSDIVGIALGDEGSDVGK